MGKETQPVDSGSKTGKKPGIPRPGLERLLKSPDRFWIPPRGKERCTFAETLFRLIPVAGFLCHPYLSRVISPFEASCCRDLTVAWEDGACSQTLFKISRHIPSAGAGKKVPVLP